MAGRRGTPAPALRSSPCSRSCRGGRPLRRSTIRRRHRWSGCPVAESCVRRRNCSPPGTNTSAWRGRSAPPDSTSTTSGSRLTSATSMARNIFLTVVGLVVPPRTVGSLAMTRHWVCATSTNATTTPPPSGSSVCSPASGDSSSTGVPGSTNASSRSRTISLPRAAMARHVLRTAARQNLFVQRFDLCDQRRHGCCVGGELGAGHSQAVS